MAVDGLRDVRDCLDVFRDAQIGGDDVSNNVIIMRAVTRWKIWKGYSTVQWYSIDDGRRHPKSSIFKKHGNYGHQ